MEFRDALKAFRRELGLAQTDVAKALHISVATVGRWETGKTAPSRSVTASLLHYAKSKSTSKECYTNLEQSLDNASKNRLLQQKSSLFSVEHSSVSQLIEEASFPVYVCDFETNDILYANLKALEILDMSLDELKKTKCYQSIMHCDDPCEMCHKDTLLDDTFISHDAYRHYDNTFYRVQGKLVQWNGRKAQVRFVMEMGGAANFTSIDDRKAKYQEQLRLHRKYASDALAVAHYNVTRGTIIQVERRDPKMRALAVTDAYEDAVAALRQNCFSAKDKELAAAISDRKTLIKLFFQGKTHISIKHGIKDFPHYYEDTLDMFQNPTTFDVEAFASLRDITDTVMAETMIETMLSHGYESIAAFHADSGKIYSFKGDLISDVIAVQKELGDDIAGVESYLREHCVDPDVDRVIKETSLPFVKEQLKTVPVWTVPCSLRQGDQIVHKLTSYSYLDEAHSLIFCVMQDVSAVYRRIREQIESRQVNNEPE